LASALGNDPLARTMTMRYDNLGRKTQSIQPTAASYFFSGSFSRFVPLDSSITPVSASGSAAFEYNALPIPPDYQEMTEFVFARLMYPNANVARGPHYRQEQ
jgi:hypothetical protein